jgi:hypothetical protein
VQRQRLQLKIYRHLTIEPAQQAVMAAVWKSWCKRRLSVTASMAAALVDLCDAESVAPTAPDSLSWLLSQHTATLQQGSTQGRAPGDAHEAQHACSAAHACMHVACEPSPARSPVTPLWQQHAEPDMPCGSCSSAGRARAPAAVEGTSLPPARQTLPRMSVFALHLSPPDLGGARAAAKAPGCDHDNLHTKHLPAGHADSVAECEAMHVRWPERHELESVSNEKGSCAVATQEPRRHPEHQQGISAAQPGRTAHTAAAPAKHMHHQPLDTGLGISPAPCGTGGHAYEGRDAISHPFPLPRGCPVSAQPRLLGQQGLAVSQVCAALAKLECAHQTAGLMYLEWLPPLPSLTAVRFLSSVKPCCMHVPAGSW